MIKAVIFDLDGVLTDTAHYHFQAWQALAHSLGIAFNEQDNEQLKGVDRLGSLRLILAKGQLSVDDATEQQLMAQKNAHYLKLIANMSEADLFSGVRPLFTALKQRGIKLAVASASKNADFVLQRLGIYNEFDAIADAALVKASKPDPEIFLQAAARLGVAPAQCLGIEDAAAGVSAINSAGMQAIGIGDAEVLHEALRVYPNIEALDIATLLTL
ncbi:beta-phosphoglucomutase [Alishewanella longhuensis]|uniref:Beta-phosphoglucomutase n=1 Tax=Alishewanella longhuensis TaxID=1091037 RepID=A0ABQ3KXD6_9ALTE|nr:beta-phosphoglucomutase [Alishewanella longhuensis]GHG63069.1 beta-phosphoglucomutase [Alishewanella longhuensis]